MRALTRSLTLCAAFCLCLLPPVALAQNGDVGGAQTERPSDDQNTLDPLIQGIFDIIINEATRPPDEPGQTPGDDVRPVPQDDVQPNDGRGPVIVPLRDEFTSDRARARIEARITDQSGVAAALVRAGDTRVRMGRVGRAVFRANMPLPSHYRPERVTIEARDVYGNRARPVTVLLRRVAACGRGGGETLTLVRSVQTSLQSLGLYAASIDGLAGPNTCGAVRTAGVAEPFSWPDIARELEKRADLERVSDVPPVIPRYVPAPPRVVTPDGPPVRPNADRGPIRGASPATLPAPTIGTVPVHDPSSAGTWRISVPDWLVPLAIGFFATLGLGAALIVLLRRVFRHQTQVKTPAAPALRLVAVPDASPKTAFAGPNLPGLVLVVDPGKAAAPRIIFDAELEEVTP